MDRFGSCSTPRALSRLLAAAALLALLSGAPAAQAHVVTTPGGVPSTGGAWHDSVPPDAGGAPSNGVDVPDEDGWDWSDDIVARPPAADLPRLPLRPAPGDLPPVEEELAPVRSTFVKGRVARMRTDGKAAIPLGAPKRVRGLIAHYNRIAGKRYKWGGGHAKLEDSGYDCSGAVGYGLIKGGLLRTTTVSGSFARWGAAGAGRWVTVYANKGHVYIEVAGLRLDTSAVGDRGGRKGVRWRPAIGKRPRFKVRHPVGL